MANLVADTGLARAFLRVGWVGLWMQLVAGAVGVALTVYSFAVDNSLGTRGWPSMMQYVTIAGLLVMTFTAIWSYRYILLGRQIGDPQNRPTSSAVRKAAGIGVAASATGLVLSMIVMLFEVTQLFLYFLRAPKAGVPVIQTDGQATWVSAGDILNLAVIVIITFVEVLVLVMSLWLLFRSSTLAADNRDVLAEDALAE